MPIDKLSEVYLEGKRAFQNGEKLADKPGHLFLNEYDVGFADAMADAVRKLEGTPK
jgi:hypothetical protein